MLTFFNGSPKQFCDGVSRRSFLKAGSLALGGLALSDFLRLKAQGAVPAAGRGKSVIMICLGGGPSHVDTYDMKPEAPAEFRGEFRPIKTNVSGMELCEMLPRQAKLADKFAVVRSATWQEPDHQRIEIFTGFPKRERRPSFGSYVSRLAQGRDAALPKFVSLRGDDQEIAAMKRFCFPFRLFFAVSACCWLAGWATPNCSDAAMLPGAKRVLFLGDSITYSGQYVEFVEAYVVTRFPERPMQFLNLGLPSETVSGLSEAGHAGGQFPRPDLHERLARVLEKTKPDVVIACYGMNDGIYLSFAEERLAKFTNGLMRLRERVAKAGAKIIHVTPPTFDEVRGKAPGYAATLDRYADWMLAQRAGGWDVVDLHGPMNRFLTERRKTDPQFYLAGDGVHAGETGHWIIAKQILMHLGADDLANVEDPKAMFSVHRNGEQLLKVIQQKQRALKDAWLTDIGHKRPGMNKGLPLAEAQAKAAMLEKQIRE